MNYSVQPVLKVVSKRWGGSVNKGRSSDQRSRGGDWGWGMGYFFTFAY